MLMRYPAAVQIRYVQTLREVASERNTTPFVSIPMNLLEPILNAITTNSAS